MSEESRENTQENTAPSAEQTVDERVVGNYRFASFDDAKEAKAEERKAAYLHAHLDYKNPENVRKIYEKAVSDRIFRTPAGLAFLSQLRTYLLKSGVGDDISPIPLYVRFTEAFREREDPTKRRIEREKERRQKRLDRFQFSLLLNIALLLMVGAMFYLTMSSPNPNILNYEQTLINKYSSWEEELNARENAVREAERAQGK